MILRVTQNHDLGARVSRNPDMHRSNQKIYATEAAAWRSAHCDRYDGFIPR